MLSNSIHFISNNVKGIQSYKNRIKVVKPLVGLFFCRRHTLAYMMKKVERRV